MSKGPKVTDTPFKGRGVKSLRSKPSNAAKRSGNLRAVDAHLSSARAAANRNRKNGPKLHGGGMLNEVGGPHPVAHLQAGGSKGQGSKVASFRKAAKPA